MIRKVFLGRIQVVGRDKVLNGGERNRFTAAVEDLVTPLAIGAGPLAPGAASKVGSSTEGFGAGVSVLRSFSRAVIPFTDDCSTFGPRRTERPGSGRFW